LHETSFFWTGALCLSAGRGVLRLARLPRHDRNPVPGEIDPRLAVYARSETGIIPLLDEIAYNLHETSGEFLGTEKPVLHVSRLVQ